MYIDKHYPFEMMPLKYNLSNFDDYLDFTTLSIHYNHIYKDAVDRLNNLLKDSPNLQALSIDEILFNQSYVPSSKRAKIERAAGSVYNHQIIFNSVTPNPITLPSNKLKLAIEKKYKSIPNFLHEFKQTALDLYGSGFVFLVCNNKGDVFIYPTNNHATTVPFDFYPIIGIDMWEHAYYLKYKNRKADYLDAWAKYIDWDYANNEYCDCLKAIEDAKKEI